MYDLLRLLIDGVFLCRDSNCGVVLGSNEVFCISVGYCVYFIIYGDGSLI